MSSSQNIVKVNCDKCVMTNWKILATAMIILSGLPITILNNCVALPVYYFGNFIVS